jgi:large subunit ribosomal protein L29
MKAKDLKDRATSDLVELRDQTRRELFSYRMKNYMGQLEDTSLIGKTRRDVARIEGILTAREAEASARGSES